MSVIFLVFDLFLKGFRHFDHHIPRQSSMASRIHHVQPGYEVCIHTCGCRNLDTVRLWPREGGACSRHARKPLLHPKCHSDCPGNLAFSTGVSREHRTRPPTRTEILDNLSFDIATEELVRLGLPPLTGNETPGM